MEQFDTFYNNTPLSTTMTCSLPNHDDEIILGYCLQCLTTFCVNCLIKDNIHQQHHDDCRTLKRIGKDFQQGIYGIERDKKKLETQLIELQEEIKKIQTTFICNSQPAIDRYEKILHRQEWMIQQLSSHKEQIQICFKQFTSQVCFDQQYISKTIKSSYEFLNNRENYFNQISDLIKCTKNNVYLQIDQHKIIQNNIDIQKKQKVRVEQITVDLFYYIKNNLSSKYLQQQQFSEFQQYWLISFYEQDFPQIFQLQQSLTEGIIKFLIDEMIVNKNISSFLILGLKMIEYYTDSNCNQIYKNYYKSLTLYYKQFNSFFDFLNNNDSSIQIEFQKQQISQFIKSTLQNLDYYKYPFQISQQQNQLVFYNKNQIQNNLNSPRILFNISLIGKIPRLQFSYETEYLKIFVDLLIIKYSCYIQMLLLNTEINQKLFYFILHILHIKFINTLLFSQTSITKIKSQVNSFYMNEFYRQIEIQEQNFNNNTQENLYNDKDQPNFNNGNNEIAIKQLKAQNEFIQQLNSHRHSQLFGFL